MSEAGASADTSTGTDAGTAAAAASLDYTPFYGDLGDEDKAFLAGKKIEPAKVGGRDLVTMLRNQEKMIGRANLESPNLADDNALKSWAGWKALGVPEKAEDYQLQRPKELPDGMQWDENREKLVRNAMLKAHVPAKFAQGVLDELVNDEVTRFSAASSSRKEAATAMDAELTRDWGNQKDTRIAEAKRGAELLAEKAGVKLDAGALADVMAGLYGNAGTIKVLHYIATAMGEDSIRGGGDQSSDPNTPSGARAEMAKLDIDQDFQKAYLDQDNPGHKSAVERYSRLMRTAHGA